MRIALCLVAALAAAGEAPDPKQQVRSVWTEAAKAGDIWTCLQAEAWAKEQKPILRLGPALGGSIVYGEPRFALPEHINRIHDAGDRLIMTTQKRAYTVATDGRPLHASVALDPVDWRQAIGHLGRAVGSVRPLGAHDQGAPGLRLGAVNLVSGKRWATVHRGSANDTLQHEMAVADDGSALAVTIASINPATGLRSYQVVIGTSARATALPDARNTHAVGRQGAWAIAQTTEGLQLIRGKERTVIQRPAAGPGLAAAFINGKPNLVLADGSLSPLDHGVALGQHANLSSIGGWLVLASGWGATVRSEGDLLGENEGEVVEQPSTLVLWRWQDLASDPAAPAFATMPGAISAVHHLPAALWMWSGRTVEILDLSGDEPQRLPYLETPVAIEWVASSVHACVTSHPDNRRTIYDHEKQVVWEGQGQEIRVKRPDLALVRTGARREGSYALHTLDRDPAKRRVHPLALPEYAHTLRVAWRDPDLAVAIASTWWRAFALDGRLVGSGREAGPQALPAPQCPEWNWHTSGRFVRDGTRVERLISPATEDPLERSRIRDAFRFGGATVLLDQRTGVHISDRRRGEWLSLGTTPRADRLAMLGTQPALIAAEGNPVVGVISPGPKLEARDLVAETTDLPVGPWRLERGRFTPPRGKQMVWDDERLGWEPVRLRSPDGSGLFVITGSVLIELDPAAARLVGR